MQNILATLFILFFAMNVKALTTVYFFEYRLKNGDLIAFEPNGRFYHAALGYGAAYLEAHPFYGVRVQTDLKKIGRLASVLRSEDDIDDIDVKVKNLLGTPFSLYSDWNDPHTTQCSKLIGQIIGVSPGLVDGGNISLSPDLLYRRLLSRGFKECQSCLLQP